MDSSSRTERIRNRTQFTWFVDKPVYKKEQTNEKSNQILLQRQSGGLPFVVNGKSELQTSESNSPHYSLDEATFLALEDLLRYEAAQNLGPTKCSRVNYLWFATLAMGYSWIRSSSRISGVKDTWNWSIHYPLASPADIYLWMNRLLVFCMPYFVPGYDASTLIAKERLVFPTQNINTEVTRVQRSGHWLEFQAAWLTWFTYRGNDGSVQAAVPPVAADLPNGTQVLTVATSADDPNTFSHPLEWTPLKVGEKTQKYLTYTWKDVLSTGLTVSDESAVDASALAHYPDESARETEIAEVVTITNTLTDTQKVTAEFWAGGPFTVSPPGMCIWFWKEYMQTFNVAHTRGFDVFFYSGLDLAIHIFETGRLVWGLKKTQMQARPIQEIRRLYRGQTLTKYDGSPVQGELWVPYQESNFVTPPFADFPSGHSAFSQSFALVMTDWFGASIPSSSQSRRVDLSLLSPVFQEAQTGVYGSFVFPAQASLIQTGVVPSAPITLQWSSWQDLADSAGLSRKYGGIHATSAHTGSQALATELHGRIRNRWFST